MANIHGVFAISVVSHIVRSRHRSYVYIHSVWLALGWHTRYAVRARAAEAGPEYTGMLQAASAHNIILSHRFDTISC